MEESGAESQQTWGQLEQLRHQLLVCRHQLGLLHQRRAADAARWRHERALLHRQREHTQTENQVSRSDRPRSFMYLMSLSL